MNRAHRTTLLAVTFGGLVASGCGATAPIGSVDDPLRIHPVGTENLSDLTLLLPTGACLPGNSCSTPLGTTPSFSLDGAAMTLNSTLRVKPGDHTLTVGATSTKITLTAGQQRTMVVPVAKQICQNDPLPTVPASDFGRVPTLSNAACPSAVSLDGAPFSHAISGSVLFNPYYYSCYYYNYGPYDIASIDCSTLSPSTYVYSMTLNGTCLNNTVMDQVSACRALQSGNCAALGISSAYCPSVTPFADGTEVAVVPGAYGFSTPTGTDTRTLAEGSVTDLAFELPVVGTVPSQFHTNLTFSDPRELPDAVATQITSNCERNYAVPSTASGTLSLNAFKFPECVYSLTVAGRTLPLSQAADNNVTLYRLDIDDVTVTREDGTTFVTAGTYELFYGGLRVAGPYPTSTGIDVLPGDYEAVVTYTTLEGQKANHYTLSF